MKFDLVIAGGGAAGCCLAVALAKANSQLQIAIIEQTEPSLRLQAFDARVLALSYGSAQILQQLDLWTSLQHKACPIETIHVSDRGHFGQTRLYAEEYNLNALGYVVELAMIGEAVSKKIAQYDNIKLFRPDSIDAVVNGQQMLTLQLKQQEISAKLLVVAEGAQSSTRDLLNIKQHKQDYHQHALIANIRLDRAHDNKAFERFTESGPIALLPMLDNCMSLVWTETPDEVKRLMSLPDSEILAELQQEFGYRAGKLIEISKRYSYPLALMTIEQQLAHRSILLGNTSHTLHPIAGQGFNLGLRDVAALQRVITKGEFELGSAQMLNCYQQLREDDHQKVIAMTDSLVHLFSNDNCLLSLGRNTGLSALQLFNPLKSTLAWQAMGLNQ